MTGAAFLERACPACGADAPAGEVRSAPRAETMSFEDLRAHWSGLFKEKVFFSYDRCGDCGLLYAPRYFTPDQLGKLYAQMAPNMELVPSTALAATQRGYWSHARHHAPPGGGYLEIGPDIGYIVGHAAREAAFEPFWLFEPNRAVHRDLAAATLGKTFTISEAMDDLSVVPDGSVGLAAMVHVLDHVLEPFAALRRVLAKLKPGGLLMIVTHNEKSLLRRAVGNRWPPFCLQHPELYNPASMERLIERAGFSSVSVERSVNYFPISFLARQAAFAVGLGLGRLPLPETAVGLRLGNLITLAHR